MLNYDPSLREEQTIYFLSLKATLIYVILNEYFQVFLNLLRIATFKGPVINKNAYEYQLNVHMW